MPWQRRAIRRSTYEARGNEIARAFFGNDGQPIGNDYGLHRWAAIYDDRGNTLEKMGFGIDGKPIAGSDGSHRTVVSYDDKNNLLSSSYFGVNGEAILWNKQYHHEEYTYDEYDREVTHAFFGTSREPINGPDDYHKTESQFDESGHLLLVTLSGPDGKQPEKLGIRSVKFTYYQNSNQVETKSYLDDKNQVRQELKYDEEGNEIKSQPSHSLSTVRPRP